MATIELNLQYHGKQSEIFDDLARYKIIASGRRFGKTRGCVLWVIERMLLQSDGLSWWVAPTYRQAKIGFRYFVRLYGKSGVIRQSNKTELSIEIINGHVLEFRSADNPDSLRGEGIDNLIIEECGIIKDEIWDDILQPMLLDNPDSHVIFIGTPKGKNWFWRVKCFADDPFMTDYKYFHFSTYDNPFIKKEDIDKLKTTMPERSFRQEIMAEFLDDAGGVFKGIDNIVKQYNIPLPYNPRHRYVMGVDLGKHLDFTVLLIMDYTERQLVYFERFNQINWEYQIDRIINAAKTYQAEIVIEVNSVGDVVFDYIKRLYNKKVIPFVTTSGSKEAIINSLSMEIDNKTIIIPFIPELINELKSFAYELTSSRNVRMSAPQGQHDDCVLSLAFACFEINKVQFKPFGIGE